MSSVITLDQCYFSALEFGKHLHTVHDKHSDRRESGKSLEQNGRVVLWVNIKDYRVFVVLKTTSAAKRLLGAVLCHSTALVFSDFPEEYDEYLMLDASV